MQTSPQTVNGAPVIPALLLSGSPATHSLHDHVKKKKRLTTMKTFRDRFHKQSYQGGNFFMAECVATFFSFHFVSSSEDK